MAVAAQQAAPAARAATLNTMDALPATAPMSMSMSSWLP
jgi:hypothetical protein